MGSMIGSGVFLLPASLAPLGWNSVIGWLITIGGALCVASVFGALSKALPKAGKYLADLPALARQRLQQAGVVHLEGNDSSPDWCTFSQAQLYFSHRRDGRSGRFAAGITLA